MIPVLLTAEREDGKPASLHLIRLVLTGVFGFFALLVLAVELFTPAFVNRLLAPGFEPATAQLTITLTRIMLIQPLILAIGSVATAVLNSRNQFLLGALALISHNVALIVGILAARLWPGLGILGPTFGVVGGAVLQTLILAPGLREAATTGWLAWEPANRRLREVVRLLIPNGLSVSVNYAGSIVDTAFASLAGEMAALGAIYNAWLLVGLPIALLGQAVGQAAFPRLATYAEAEKWGLLRRTLLQSLGVVAALAVVALLSLIYLGRPTIRLLFERGEFTATAGDLTYLVLIAYAVALPAYVSAEVITRGLIALRDTRTPLLTNLLQLAGRTVIMALFVDRFGVVTIPAALAITATLEALILGAVLLAKVQARIRAYPR